MNKDSFNIIKENTKLDRASDYPMYRQLADSICNLWEAGEIGDNEKLPSIRKMASAFSVNNITIVNAYKFLENKKAAYSIMGSGTYMAALDADEKSYFDKNWLNKKIRKYKSYGSDDKIINFAHGSVSPELFPVKDFKILFNEALERDKGNAFGYEQSQGYQPLRTALCGYLEKYNIKTDMDKIQIISGAQQGIDIIAKAILSYGDKVITEGPTYYGAAGAFLSRGAEIVTVPVEKDGMDINKLTGLIKLHKPKLLYIMPYFQTPTCVNTSLEKKRKILELSKKYNFYIIEEDNQSEFNFSDEEIIPMKALDYKNRVIYVKSFSKILMPGLRLGFMVLPQSVLHKVFKAKYTTDIATSGFLQRAFHLYIEKGSFYEHIENMRKIFIKRYEMAKESSNKYLKGILEYEDPGGGLNYWYKLPEGENSEDFTNRLLAKNVLVYPGALFSLDDSDIPNIRISYANVTEEDIEKGIKIIRQVLL